MLIDRHWKFWLVLFAGFVALVNAAVVAIITRYAWSKPEPLPAPPPQQIIIYVPEHKSDPIGFAPEPIRGTVV